jgi:hypothetical protein
VVAGLHFLFFSVTMGGQPVGYRRPSSFLNLPIMVLSYKQAGILTTELPTKR